MSYILKRFCFQAKVKWLDYNSKHAAGVVRTPPKFHDFPEKWPIRKNETPIPSYSRSVELTLSLDVLGYMKEKRVRNDKVHYTLAHAKDGVRHIGDIEEGFVMKNDPFRKEMLISPVVIPMEENVFFEEQLENVNLVPIKYYQLRCESSQKAASVFKKVKFEEPEDSESSDESDEEHVTSRCDKKTVFDKKVTVLVTRGIEATIPAKMPKKKTKIDVKQAYRKYYFNIFLTEVQLFFS